MGSTEMVHVSVLRFIDWLNRHGETPYDHQSYFASDLGRRKGDVLHKADVRNTCSGTHDFFQRSVCAISPPIVLEEKISDRRCTLRDGLRFYCAGVSKRTIP